MNNNIVKILLCVSLCTSLNSCLGKDFNISQIFKPTIDTQVKQNKLELKTLEKGIQSGIKEAKNYVIQNKDDFKSFWDKHVSNLDPKPSLPDIDFNNSTVIGIFIGEVPSNNKIIEINNVIERDKKVYVEYSIKEQQSPLTVVTYPYHIIIVNKKLDTNVEFKQINQTSEDIKKVSFDIIQKGTQSGIIEQNLFIIKEKAKWEEVYQKHIKPISLDNNYPKTPEIDFNKNTLIALFLGARPSSGYDINIAKVEETKENINIYFNEIKPKTSDIVATLMTYPYIFITIKNIDKPIKVFKDDVLLDLKEEKVQNTLDFSIIEKGQDGCIEEKASYVINDYDEFAKIYRKNLTCKPAEYRCPQGTRCLPTPPDVDFSKHTVLAIFGGKEISGCDPKIEIKDIIESEDKIKVNIAIPPQSPDIRCVRAVFNPYIYVVIPKVNKSVEFIYPQDFNGMILPIVPVESLSFKEITKGSRSFIKEYREVVIKTKEEFIDLWNEHTNSNDNLPEINFDKQTVLGIFLGKRPSGGYSVNIEKVVVSSDKIIQVYAKEFTPGPNTFSAAVITYPYILVSVDRKIDNVKFILERVSK